MKRFDLTFKGDILPDFDPVRVREGFAELFRISDPLVLDELFSGDAFVLRSNLDRKSAADYFRRISQVGGRAELVTREIPAHVDSMPETADELFTRLPADDPAAFVAATKRDKGNIIYSSQHSSNTPVSPDQQTEAVGLSAGEVLERLQRLQRDAETAHNSRLEQLQQIQAEVKAETSATLEQIKRRREQVLIDTQDEISRLEELEASTRSQHETDVALIASEEEEQSRRLHKDLKRLEQEHGEKQLAASNTAEQLELDRENCPERNRGHHRQAGDCNSRSPRTIRARHSGDRQATPGDRGGSRRARHRLRESNAIATGNA